MRYIYKYYTFSVLTITKVERRLVLSAVADDFDFSEEESIAIVRRKAMESNPLFDATPLCSNSSAVVEIISSTRSCKGLW